MTPAFLQRLALGDDADERAIRRAYARELKLIDQDADPAAFQTLREAYEAALAWAQWHNDEQAAEATVQSGPQPDMGTGPGTDTGAKPAPTRDCAPSMQADPAAMAEADEACAAFLPDGETAPLTSAFWRARLEDCLDKLVSIAARERFEQHIADLLAQGWRTGHETLLVAATAVFSWQEERRRLYGLGLAGMTLDLALAEHAAFLQQSEAARWAQSRLIARLRDPRPATTGELLRHHPALAILQANYSNWLSLITSTATAARWQQDYARVPAWRRQLSPSGWRRERSGGLAFQSSFSWKWLWVLLIIGLVRMCANFSGDQPTPPPAPRQQTAKKTMYSGDYLRDGNAQLQRGEFEQAIDSYNQVIGMAPNNFMAYIGRGTAYLSLGDDRQAQEDFDQSASIESDNQALHVARGKLADYRNQPAEAANHYTAAIDMLQQADAEVVWRRAAAYRASGDYLRSLADVNVLIDSFPKMPTELYAYRVDLLLQLGRKADADAAVKAMLATSPKDSEAYRLIAEHYRAHGQIQKADAMLERGIRQAPDDSLLLARARQRDPGDLAGRRADLARAGMIAPASFIIAQQRADVEIAAGNPAAADEILVRALKAIPSDNENQPLLLAMRGVVAARRGERPVAEQYFSDALKASHTSWQKNEICWLMAERNAALSTALFICDAALELKPDSRAAHDSRGLVLLRLGRYHEALEAYQTALQGRPDYAPSLLGRGLARQRLGDRAGGEADIKAALKTQPGLRKDYSSYGFKL